MVPYKNLDIIKKLVILLFNKKLVILLWMQNFWTIYVGAFVC